MRRFVPTKTQRDQVQKLIGFGLSEEQIALLMVNPHTGKPITAKTLRVNFRHELSIGIAHCNAAVAQSLFKKATGNGPQAVSAAIFWMKARFGWRESNRVELTGPNGEQLALTPSYGPDADYVLARLIPESVRARAQEAIAKAQTE